MQLKIARNNKNCKSFPLLDWETFIKSLNKRNINPCIVPFDEHRFQNIFTKLYNRLFVMEEFKYLPPKYSYAMKDLAVDYGIFERMDVSSVISGSTSLTMTTTSGFNANFNNDNQSLILKEKDYTSFPLSPIKE